VGVHHELQVDGVSVPPSTVLSSSVPVTTTCEIAWTTTLALAATAEVAESQPQSVDRVDDGMVSTRVTVLAVASAASTVYMPRLRVPVVPSWSQKISILLWT